MNKSKKYIVLVTIAMAVLGLLSIPLRRLAPPVPPGTKTDPAQPAAGGTQTPALSNNSERKVLTQAEREAVQGKQERYLAMASMIGRSKNKPINFYGRIVDQHNQPVSGVAIKLSASYFPLVANASLYPNTDEFERICDVDGRFSVVGRSGLTLCITLQTKQGYQFDPNNSSDRAQLALNYSSGRGTVTDDEWGGLKSTADNPYIFRAYKKIGAEPLYHGSFAFGEIVPDGRVYTIRLLGEKVVEGEGAGELMVMIKRPLGQRGQSPYDWAIKLNGLDVELVESVDKFMNLAPDSGYKSSWELMKNASEPGYSRDVDTKFYFRNRDGTRYGWLEFLCRSARDESAAVILRYWINPSGSRNLEYDPEKKLPNPK